MKDLYFLTVFAFCSVLFALAALIANFICAPHANSDDKKEIYECGMPLFSNCDFKFNFKYINYVIIFLVFDVETVFLFPLALYFPSLELFALLETFIFIFLLLFALLYVLKINFAGKNVKS